jgi:hypothetical protein
MPEKPSKPKPECLALLLCEGVIEDSRTKNKTVLNMFNQISAAQFPAQHDRLCIFVSLTNGRGTSEVDVRVVRADLPPGEGVLVGMKGEVTFPDPLHVVELGLDIRRLVFPSAGTYDIEVLVDGEPLKRRRFAVTETRTQGGKQ